MQRLWLWRVKSFTLLKRVSKHSRYSLGLFILVAVGGLADAHQDCARVLVGFHASPRTDLTQLDPAYSKNTSRYGPGAYFYFEEAAAQNHAAATRDGRLRFSQNPSGEAQVYRAKRQLDERAIFDANKTYSQAELQKIVDVANQTNFHKIPALAASMTGDAFYPLLYTSFQSSVSLARGEMGLTTARSLANAVLKSVGIKAIIGNIPDPDSGGFKAAFIMLDPIDVQKN